MKGASGLLLQTEWKYLDVDDLTARDSSEGGNDGRAKGEKSKTGDQTVRARTSRSGRPAASRGVIYYEPPPKQVPFRELTDKQVIAWYLGLPGDLRRRVLENTASWKWFTANKRDHAKLVAMAELIKADALASPPSTTEIATYLKQMAGPPCSCGWRGYPFENHMLDARQCFKWPPPEFAVVDGEDDDDLPF